MASLWHWSAVGVGLLLGGLGIRLIRRRAGRVRTSEARSRHWRLLREELQVTKSLLEHAGAETAPLDDRAWQSARGHGLTRGLDAKKAKLLHDFYTEVAAHNFAVANYRLYHSNPDKGIADYFRQRIKGNLDAVLALLNDPPMTAPVKVTTQADPWPQAAPSSGPKWRRSTEGWLYALFLTGLLLAFVWTAPFVVSLPPLARIPILVMCGLALSMPGMLVSQRYHPAEAAALGSAVLSAFATIVLALVVTRQARDVAEETLGSDDLVKGMRAAQELQYQSFLQAWLEPGINPGSYVLTVRNFGGGVARNIEASAQMGGRVFTSTHTLLGPGEEVTEREMVPAAGETSAAITVRYLDALEQPWSATFTQKLGEASVPQSRYSQWREASRHEQQHHQEQMQAVTALSQSIRDAVRELKRPAPPPHSPPPDAAPTPAADAAP